MNQLEEARAQIATLDKEMAALFEQRMRQVESVLSYKMAHG
ncbi:MAG: chorismate mutase, partial [Bacteroidales bacterium]|nr:chorismate mutase [Bacteroidales bacterium]